MAPRRTDGALVAEVERHHAEGRPIPDRTIVPGKPSRGIVRVAQDQSADLVVMGVHGHGVVDELLFGSTTHHEVREAPCPVLSVRQPSRSGRE